jgi:hypothetical protein
MAEELAALLAQAQQAGKETFAHSTAEHMELSIPLVDVMELAGKEYTPPTKNLPLQMDQ